MISSQDIFVLDNADNFTYSGLSSSDPINENTNGKTNDGLNNAVFEKFTRYRKIFYIMKKKIC